jgi:homoserine O-acetyltransferase
MSRSAAVLEAPSSSLDDRCPAHECCGASMAPMVVMQGGISARQHVCAHDGDRSPGWWDTQCGDGLAVDPARFRVLSFDYLEGGATTADQADALVRLLDDLGVERLHSFVGCSYGAMVGLAFAVRHPTRLERLIAISGSHRAHPMAVAWRRIQRRIVELGVRQGTARESLSLARELAMTTYRTPEEFAARFGGDGGPAELADYLEQAGRRFADYPIERFLSLSRSLDEHAIVPEELTVPTTLVGVTSDRLVPIEDLRELARRAPRALLVEIESIHGHDAFLKEPAAISRVLGNTLGGVA